MFRFKTPQLCVLLALAAPACGFAADNYCIASAGGFGHGGTTYVGKNFPLPAAGGCLSWQGFTKTASTVVLNTYGSGCLSSDGKVLTVSVSSADPSFLGAGNVGNDYIRLVRKTATVGFTSGTDMGTFGGSALPTTCTAALLTLPATHD